MADWQTLKRTLIFQNIYRRYKRMQTQTIEFATVVKDGIIQQIGKAVIEEPKTNFKGDPVKFYEDKPKKESK